MLTCKQVSELVSLSLDRRLGWIERWRMCVHLKACEGCRNFSSQIAFLRTAFRNHPVVKEGREERK